MITVSAPAKIHLLGEHSVVYGKPALLSSINKRLYVSLKSLISTSRRQDKFRNDREIIIKTEEKDDLVRQAINIFKKSFMIERLPFLELKIASEIPVGSGLGSSAALSSATIGALMKFVKNIWNPAKINELVFAVEKIAHGNPSGADNTTVVFGGLVWFRLEFEFLKSIWHLPISSYKIPQLAIIDTGRPKETTKEMVEQVARRYSKEKNFLEAILNQQEQLTKRLLLSFRADNRKELIDCFMRGERNLEMIGVVGKLAKTLIREIEKNGGAAKICGGGGVKEGSGMVLCYHQKIKKIENIAQKLNLPFSLVTLGEEGIRVEDRQHKN